MEDKEYKIEIRHRYELINALIQSMDYKSYLEVGVQDGVCFRKVICENKVGVDPDPYSEATIFQTSDEFFENNTQEFDIIFLDGLHHEDQNYRDIINALSVLAPRGTIVVHDCNPLSDEAQRVPRMQAVWNGDVWKAWVKLRMERSDLSMMVLDTDHGCGIIRRGKQEVISIDEELSYENLDKNRTQWLNIVGSLNFLYEAGATNQ